MIVVTAGTTEYRTIVDAQVRKCAEFGYQHLVYDLGGLGIGEPYAVERKDLEPSFNGDSLPPATFKPALMARAMERILFPELVCWLDADCLPLRPFHADVNGLMFDAAVTLRPKPEVGTSGIPALDYLNSGVVWIRNNACGRAFLRSWSDHSMALRTDQGGLNASVAPGFQVSEEWEASRNHILATSSGGARVLILDGMEWNCWHLPPKPDTRILHFKRGIRAAAVNYL